MKLNDFVRQTLIEISKGVYEAKGEIDGKMGIINPMTIGQHGEGNIFFTRNISKKNVQIPFFYDKLLISPREAA